MTDIEVIQAMLSILFLWAVVNAAISFYEWWNS